MKLDKYIILRNFRKNSQDKFIDIERVILLSLIGNSFADLTEEEILFIEDYLTHKKADKILDMLQTKYTKAQWQKLLDSKIQPIVKSYMEEVALREN